MNKQIRNKKSTLSRALVLAHIFAAGMSTTALADSMIDPVNQTYFVSETERLGRTLLARTYSSGTVFRGVFGVGWCSELDARVMIYDRDESRFRGCEISSARMIEGRLQATGVSKTPQGFVRTREDGALQYFSSAGWLEKISREDADFKIVRDSDQKISELIVKSRGTEMRFEVRSDLDSRDGLIQAIGSRFRFEYADGMLVKAGARYAYDDTMNMIERTDNGLSEVIRYDREEDRVVQIARSTAFGRDRLLLTLAKLEKSIEMKIEVERGAGTRPVRILYDRITRRASLEGNRDLALRILNWIRA